MGRGEQGRDLAAPSRPGVSRCESPVSWDVAMPEGHQSLRQDVLNILPNQNVGIFTTSWKLSLQTCQQRAFT